MADYEPLDLAAFCNAGADIYPPRLAPTGGAVTFHGLPFLIGEDEGRKEDRGIAPPDSVSSSLHRPSSSDTALNLQRPTLVAFGEGLHTEPISIPVGVPARTVIFAHARLDSKIAEGDPVGRPVAEYEFVYHDGERVRVPIRERFEIGAVPWIWGQDAFLAWPDRQPDMQPRYEGRWGSAGNRQTEVNQGSPRSLYLWPWKNPRPEEPIETILIHPAGPKFALAAITLGHLEEEPFPREARREVLITLPHQEDAEKPFALAVEVDRGAATYPYALPASDPDAFLKDDFKGWGERQN